MLHRYFYVLEYKSTIKMGGVGGCGKRENIVDCCLIFFSSLSPFLFQRAHLLDNTERLERSSRRLEAGYQIAVETGKNSESEQIVLLMHSSLHNT